MKITRLHITEWRNLRDVTFDIPEDASLVCLVGENGTGKSNVLELLGSAANQLGLTPGVEQHRGNPFDQQHSFSITLKVGSHAATALTQQLSGHQDFAKWDGTLTLTRSRGASGATEAVIAAGGVGTNKETGLVPTIIRSLQQLKEIQYLSLDADRSYPPLDVHANTFMEAMKTELDSLELLRGQSFKPARTMYDEWIRYMVGKEGQAATRHYQAERRASDSQQSRPQFNDPSKPYKESLRKVLSHITFVGVDLKKLTLVFDTAGLELNLTQLSGGEREIAFLVGQIERFKLRRGLLLVDEPELHLNPDLVRAWVTYLRDTIDDGQVWIATHSLEAAEVAGRNATFVMERDPHTRLVNRVSSLKVRPVLSALAGALGSPAFSLSQLRFIYIEGERHVNARERFHKLCGAPEKNRFMEGGSGKGVLQQLTTVKQLAAEDTENLSLHAGGILDRDFKDDEQVKKLIAENAGAIFVLGCHEVENFFLHPQALSCLLSRSGEEVPEQKALLIIQEASDRLAGGWILEAATADNSYRNMPKVMKQEAWEKQWAEIEADIQAFASQLSNHYEAIDKSLAPKLSAALAAAARRYAKVRASDDLWKRCMGKQVVSSVATSMHLTDVETLEKHVRELWRSKAVPEPQELIDLRAFVDSL